MGFLAPKLSGLNFTQSLGRKFNGMSPLDHGVLGMKPSATLSLQKYSKIKKILHTLRIWKVENSISSLQMEKLS